MKRLFIVDDDREWFMLLESEEDDSLMMMENDLCCCLLMIKRESDEDEWFSVYGYGVWSYFNVEWNKEEDEVGVVMLCKMMKEVLLLCWKKWVVVMKLFFLVIVMFLVLWRMSFITDFISFCDVISEVIIFLKMMKMCVVYVMDKKWWMRGWVMKVTEMRLGGVKWWRFSFDDDETYSSPICFRCTLINTNRKSCFPQYFLFCLLCDVDRMMVQGEWRIVCFYKVNGNTSDAVLCWWWVKFF